MRTSLPRTNPGRGVPSSRLDCGSGGLDVSDEEGPIDIKLKAWNKALASGALAAALFVWGFMAHRSHLFPYSPLRSLAIRAGIVEAPRPKPPVWPRPIEIEGSAARFEQLATLPYVASSFDPDHERSGVLYHDEDRSYRGLNFYNASDRSVARVVDMSGRVLHEWSYAYRSAEGIDPGSAPGWHHAELLGNGDILVVLSDTALIRLDSASRLLWAWDARVHHDVWADDHGDIHCIVREPQMRPELHAELPVFIEKIVRLSSEGRPLEELSVYDLLRASRYAYLIPSVAHRRYDEHITALDLLHVNHVELFDGSQAGSSPLYKRGNLLISIKSLNAVAVVDGESHEIVWLWGPNNVILQHQPTLVPGGRLVMFDNGTRASRILEIDPGSNGIVWSYENGERFFSFWGGSVQRLPNGNTLITETDRGRAFEVTPAGDTVWMFANPDVDSEGNRTNIWRMVRYRASDRPFLATLDSGDR